MARYKPMTGVVDVNVMSISRGCVEISFADRRGKKWPVPIHLYEDDTVRINFALDEHGAIEDAWWTKGTFRNEI